MPFRDIKISTAPAYLVKDIIPRCGLVIAWGPPKCGKSSPGEVRPRDCLQLTLTAVSSMTNEVHFV